MKKNIGCVELTKELYLEVSADISSEIVTLKQNKDDKILQIEGRLETLRDLKQGLKGIKKNIKAEKRLLRKNKVEKFSISRALSKANRYAKSLNRSYSKGCEFVDFYSEEKSKAR